MIDLEEDKAGRAVVFGLLGDGAEVASRVTADTALRPRIRQGDGRGPS
jgi:hypothetical protein